MKTVHYKEVKRMQVSLLNSLMEPVMYKSWTDEFARQESSRIFNQFREAYCIDPNLFSYYEAKELEFGTWAESVRNKQLLLCPLWMHPFLKEGIKLNSIPPYTGKGDGEIAGEAEIVTYDKEGKSSIDNDARGGFLAYGVVFDV